MNPYIDVIKKDPVRLASDYFLLSKHLIPAYELSAYDCDYDELHCLDTEDAMKVLIEIQNLSEGDKAIFDKELKAIFEKEYTVPDKYDLEGMIDFLAELDNSYLDEYEYD